jgi:hypothetical protein
MYTTPPPDVDTPQNGALLIHNAFAANIVLGLWPGRQPKVFPMLVSALFRDQAPRRKCTRRRKHTLCLQVCSAGYSSPGTSPCASYIVSPLIHDRDDTKAVVNRVPNCLYRGYSTLRDAEAAFAYAQARGWTRVSHAPLSGNPALPRPIESAGLANEHNPLHGMETLDDRWFIVYRGIAPGMYRSQ